MGQISMEILRRTGSALSGNQQADDNEADAIALLVWAIETNGGVA